MRDGLATGMLTGNRVLECRDDCNQKLCDEANVN